MAIANTHKYIPRIEQREENLFIEEYYSSTDTKIYFDDIEQTEISYINYSLQEQLKPLYGYASRTFDDVSVGNRIVTGTFKIPIKNPELQSQPSDIMLNAHGGGLIDVPAFEESKAEEHDTAEEYNKEEDEDLLSHEWVQHAVRPSVLPDTEDTNTESTNTGDNNHSTGFDFNAALEEKTNDDDIYKEKLAYIFDANGSGGTIANGYSSMKDMVSAFQIMNGIYADGTLTDDLREKIDLAFASLEGSNSFMLPAGSRIYSGPGIVYGNTVLDTAQKATCLNTLDKWLYIITENGISGYIQREDV